MQDHVKALAAQAAKCRDATDAMKFAQAALNLACAIERLSKLEEQTNVGRKSAKDDYAYRS